MTVKSIVIEEKQVYYTVMGQGQPVVLIHGFAEDSDVWRYQVQTLSKFFLLIIPDLPGSGRSAMLKDMSIEGLAGSIKSIMDAERLENSLVIGHSMGGYITLALAEKYPGLLKGIGLFHSTAFADTEEKKAIRRRGIAFMQTQGSAAFIAQSVPNLFTEDYRIKNNAILAGMTARYSSFDALALVAYYEAMIQRPDRTTVLQSINKPVLFIIGKQDKAIPFEDSMQQCHLPQMAMIHILEQSAHMGMWEEKEKSSQAMLSFLQNAQQF